MWPLQCSSSSTKRAFGTGLSEAEISKCRPFSNLTCLSVGHLCLNCQLGVISSFLEHCPNLKKLSLEHFGCICEVQCSCKQIKVAQFRCEQLETVKVKFHMVDTSFHWVVKYLQEAVINLCNCRHHHDQQCIILYTD